jgi:anti-anti-sigma regulatory factor
MNTCCKLHESAKSTMWTFPRHVSFEAATGYLYQLRSMDLSGTVIFDLSETEAVHSSFIGLMIDLKEKAQRFGGELEVRLSPALVRHFSRMNIYQHFISGPLAEAMQQTIKKAAL